MTGLLSDDVQQLLLGLTDSYEKVYVLVALFKSDHALTFDALMKHLQLSLHTVVEALEPLRRARVVIEQGSSPRRFMYAVGDPARDASVAKLALLVERRHADLARVLDRAALQRVRDALGARWTGAVEPA
ncbi:MAG: hypothetical protein ABW321_32365 [Polyangiales bacterium]